MSRRPAPWRTGRESRSVQCPRCVLPAPRGPQTHGRGIPGLVSGSPSLYWMGAQPWGGGAASPHTRQGSWELLRVEGRVLDLVTEEAPCAACAFWDLRENRPSIRGIGEKERGIVPVLLPHLPRQTFRPQRATGA